MNRLAFARFIASVLDVPLWLLIDVHSGTNFTQPRQHGNPEVFHG